MNISLRYHRSLDYRALAIQKLGINRALIAVAISGVETVWPALLYSFYPNSSTIGFVTAGFAIISLLSLAFFFPLFQKFSARSLFFAAVGCNALMIALFAYAKSPIIFFILAAINVVFGSLRYQSFGVLVRTNSSNKSIERNERVLYLVGNIGWVIGPLLAGFLAKELSVNAVLMMASMFLIFSVYSITMATNVLEHYHNKKSRSVSIFKNFFHFFHKKKRILSYVFSAGLEIWWALAYIFIPLEMLNAGMDMGAIGLFIFFLALPLIITQWAIQKITIKNQRMIFATGYGLAAICALGASFSSNIHTIIAYIIIASFGMGLIEPTAESYFFNTVNAEQATRYYGTFFTSKTIGGFFGRLMIAIILIQFAFKYALLGIAASMTILAIIGLVKKRRKHRKKY